MLQLLRELQQRGVTNTLLLIRHGAREFAPGKHDLENPLTDAGRAAAQAFGAAMPGGFAVRAYASPVTRCTDTAQLALAGYAAQGGNTTRVRPMEGLGVFYALDQMKMYRIMQAAGGLAGLLDEWIGGRVGADVMLDAGGCARALARLLQEKLLLEKLVQEKLQQEKSSDEVPADAKTMATSLHHRLQLLVTHDMTLGLVRHQLLGQSMAKVGPVDFLEGVAVYEHSGEVWMQSPHGPASALPS